MSEKHYFVQLTSPYQSLHFNTSILGMNGEAVFVTSVSSFTYIHVVRISNITYLTTCLDNQL